MIISEELLKYIRTKDGRIMLIQEEREQEIVVLFDNELVCINKRKVLNQADTIEELCDEFVVFYDYERVKCNHRLYWTLDEAKIAFNRRKEKGKKDLSKLHLCGVIWIKDSNGEPILKSVAKMNNNGKLELL